jgi:hypothetical protein
MKFHNLASQPEPETIAMDLFPVLIDNPSSALEDRLLIFPIDSDAVVFKMQRYKLVGCLSSDDDGEQLWISMSIFDSIIEKV